MSKNINAVIFDLGKVIVETDLDKTLSTFRIAQRNPTFSETHFFENEFFKQFELGQISQTEFFQKIKKHLSLNADLDYIENAWNSMIIGVSQQSIAMLLNLKNRYPTFALSNTNSSHATTINEHLNKNHQIKNIQELFHKVYYSHELKIGKPDKKIFEYVIADANLNPAHTLFIDDNKENIQVSKEIGFQTIHLIQQHQLEYELKQLGLLKNEI